MADKNQTPKKQTRPVEAIRPPEKKTATAQESKTMSAPVAKKSTSTLKIVLIVVAVLIGLSILGSILTGLFAKNLLEGGLSGLTGGKAKVDTNSGAVTITDKDTNATVSTTQKLPDGFPKDVPVYEPSTIRFSASLTKNSYNVTLSTNDSPEKVKEYYTRELKQEDWQEKPNSSVTFGAITTTTYTKDNKELTVVITGSSDASKSTAVSLSVKTN